jgi:O-antigen ligase
MVSFIVVTFTRSAWLALAVQSVLFTVFLVGDRDLRVRWPAPKRVMATALAIAVLVASTVTFAVLGRDGVTAAWDRVAEVWRAFGSPPPGGPDGGALTGVEHRRAMWLNTAAMVREAPLRGVGLGNHSVVYPEYARAASADRFPRAGAPADFAHNDYLQLVAELGAVGAGISAWLAVALARMLRVLWRREEAERRALVLGVGLGLAGLGVDAAFSFPLYQALPPLVCAVYLGVLAALATRFGWDARAWWLFDAARGLRRMVPPLVAAAAAALLAATAWWHARSL